MASKLYFRTSLTGGTSGALDGIDGAVLADGDGAIAVTTGYFYLYRLNINSGASESSPQIITPDINPGDKRWELLTVASQQDIEDQLTLQGLIVEQEAKVKGELEVLQDLTVDGFFQLNNNMNTTGNIDADGFTINGTPVGISTDTYWNVDGDGNIYYRSGNVLGNPISLNKHEITNNWEIPSGYHGMSVGPLNIDATITINGIWKIL